MQCCSGLRTKFLTVIALIGVLCASARAQEPPNKDAERKEAPAESKGMPPRTAATEYQAHGQAGAVTIGAEFTGHSVATPEATYSSEDFVIVEVGLFGPPQARIKQSLGDFSLRINGKKIALASQPYERAFRSLKDPQWEPPKTESKSKTSIGDGGNTNADSLPVVVHMPIELKRAMEQHVERAALLEGDRALPQAGLLFFEYRGKTQNIRSLELIYSGPAGTATLALQP